MISLTTFIYIMYSLMLFIGLIYAIHENVFSNKIWKIIKYILILLTFIVALMMLNLMMLKDETFSIVSTYNLTSVNSMIIQEYKNEYIVFMEDQYIHFVNIPKENTRINYGYPKLELKETITKRYSILPIIEDKIINYEKEYLIIIPDKSYIQIVNLQ